MTDSPGDGGQPQDPYGAPPHGRAPYGQTPYGQAPYGATGGFPPGGYVPDHPRATSSLVLGILGIVVCGILAPFAWVVGKRTVREIDASNGRLGGRGSAQAGYVLGVVGTVLLGLGLALALLLVVLVVAGGIASSTT